MKRFLQTVAALLTAAPFAAAQPRPREPMDEAIDRGLAYLRQVQNRDGSWAAEAGFGQFGPRGQMAGGGGDPAITALAVMAFLSAGKVPDEGSDGATVARGIRFVMSRQQKGRAFSQGLNGGGTEMYYHGICTLMLAEAAGMTDGKLADELKLRLEDAVNVLLRGQRNPTSGPDAGGWRYRVDGTDSDLSVTGWQLMALRAAKNVGCDVPAERIQAAVDYIHRCHDPNTGGFRYTTRGSVTVPCTGTGILALELCGKEFHRSEPALRAGSFILNNPLSPRNQHFFYGVYYTSQGMFQLGENFWKSYRPKLHALLLQQNPPQRNGAWYGGGGFDDQQFGPTYCTPMAILALTVEYRLLPIYQRFEEPKERDGSDK
jgi:Squalene-hopene cyclase C-terminal domain